MKIRNPNWHPKSLAELTVAQRRNLKRLANGLVAAKTAREIGSFDSLCRHGLCGRHGYLFGITPKGRRALSGSSF